MDVKQKSRTELDDSELSEPARDWRARADSPPVVPASTMRPFDAERRACAIRAPVTLAARRPRKQLSHCCRCSDGEAVMT